MDTLYTSLKDELVRKMLRSTTKLMQSAIANQSKIAFEGGFKGLGLACELLMKMIDEGLLTFEEANELAASESELACGDCYTQEMAKQESHWVIENALKILYPKGD